MQNIIETYNFGRRAGSLSIFSKPASCPDSFFNPEPDNNRDNREKGGEKAKIK
jgi:hypothetical protein